MNDKNITISDLISRFTGLLSGSLPKGGQKSSDLPPRQNQVLPPYPKNKATIDFLRRHDELKNKIKPKS